MRADSEPIRRGSTSRGRGLSTSSRRARLVAEHFGTDHHELHVAGGDAASVIERLIGHHDAPFGDAANIPLYLLCEQLGGDNKVILQGDGGDEIFAGYRTHSLMAIDRWARMLARSSSWAAPFIPLGARFYPLLQRLIHSDRALRFALIMANSDIDDPPALVFGAEARSLLETNDPFSRYRELYHCFEHLDVVQRALYTDCGILLPDVFFEKVDKATMAHGIEARVPLVDTRLASYVMGLPAKYKVRGFHKKRVLRQALRGVVPDSVLDHPKVGFGVPVSHWLRTTLAGYMRSVLLDASRPSASLFDGVVLRGVRRRPHRWPSEQGEAPVPVAEPGFVVRRLRRQRVDASLYFLGTAVVGALAAYGVNSLLHNSGPFVGDWAHFFIVGLVFSIERIVASRIGDGEACGEAAAAG